MLFISGGMILGLFPQIVKKTDPAAQSGNSKIVKKLKIFSQDEIARVDKALANAEKWLDNLHVDPIELREHGIKGKKKLVEKVESYKQYMKIASEKEKLLLFKKIKALVAITSENRYHDMLKISDKCFDEDSTSYLRAAYLMDKLGISTEFYRKEILKMKPRLDERMKFRGPNQQRVFYTYYQHFGMKEPFPLGQALEKGIIAQRKSISTMNLNEVYDLTHEVFALYDFGDNLKIDHFSSDEKKYLLEVLPGLIEKAIAFCNPDIGAELIECLTYLRFFDLPIYHQGLNFLLGNQNPDGSWGNYESQRPVFGDYIRQGFNLHCTMVVTGALISTLQARFIF